MSTRRERLHAFIPWLALSNVFLGFCLVLAFGWWGFVFLPVLATNVAVLAYAWDEVSR